MNKKTTKGIVAAAAVLAVLFVAMKIMKPKKTVPQGDSGGGGTNDGGSISGANPNLDFRSLANQLFDAFDGYGTANKKVKDIFKLLKSNADYDALKAAYGVREVSSGTGNIFVSNYEGDLPSTLRNEMSKSEINELNQILTSNGITRAI